MGDQYIKIQIERLSSIEFKYGAHMTECAVKALLDYAQIMWGKTCRFEISSCGTFSLEINAEGHGVAKAVDVTMIEAGLKKIIDQWLIFLLEDDDPAGLISEQCSINAMQDSTSTRSMVPQCRSGEFGAATKNCELELIARPVCAVDNKQMISHYSCAVRSVDAAPACEKFPGLVSASALRLIDDCVTHIAIRALVRNNHLRLRIPLHASSLLVDDAWGETFERLSQLPAVANRLMFSIAETARFDVDEGRKWVNCVRRANSTIAITGFGCRYGENVHRAIVRPDVIVLGAGWCLRAQQNEREYERFAGMVDLAEHMASDVVVSGVDTAADMQLVMRKGACLVEGGLMGRAVRCFASSELR